MSDLVENHEDRFSYDAAHLPSTRQEVDLHKGIRETIEILWQEISCLDYVNIEYMVHFIMV